jgi:hypothetical protein
VIVPSFDDAVLGRSLGFSAAEVPKLNKGLDYMPDLIVRDCPLFRYDQTILGINFYKSIEHPHVNDLYKYGGWRSTKEHPEQVIWSHRRRGDFRFLPWVPYRLSTALVGVPWGLAVYLRMLFLNYRWLLRPSVHAHVARRLVAKLR